MPTIKQLQIMREAQFEFGLDHNHRPLTPPSKNYSRGTVIGKIIYDHENNGLKIIPNSSETEKSDS